MEDSNVKPGPSWGKWIRVVVVSVLLAGIVSAVVTAGVAALLVNIFQHKEEARNPFYRVVDLTDDTEDPAIWGKNFPQQYDAYMKTADMVRTRFGGSEAMPRVPTDTDPRTFTSRSKLDLDPRLKTMWAGYSFSKDYRERRGHYYMLEDQTYTGRQQAAPQPGACLNCHASLYLTYKKLGDGDLVAGFRKLNALHYPEARELVTHPVACIDCHDPATMQLRITRPAFMEGIRNFKASQGIADYDVNTVATRQEMRSFVCGQCHVDYYFKGPDKQLTFPWAKGIKGDEILGYLDESGVTEWKHAESGAPCAKARHPEFEMWNQGIHARSGVACADCHMPYKRVGALKVSDHHVRSPLLNINSACQTCHRFPEAEMKKRVELIQERTEQMANVAMDALVALIADIKAAQTTGATDEQLAAPRDRQRKAQFLLDFVLAENSAGFHAPQEAARILLQSLNHAREGQLVVRQPLAKAASTPAGS